MQSWRFISKLTPRQIGSFPDVGVAQPLLAHLSETGSQTFDELVTHFAARGWRAQKVVASLAFLIAIDWIADQSPTITPVSDDEFKALMQGLATAQTRMRKSPQLQGRFPTLCSLAFEGIQQTSLTDDRVRYHLGTVVSELSQDHGNANLTLTAAPLLATLQRLDLPSVNEVSRGYDNEVPF